ncbi:glycosyltransferase [Lichenibacterium dinghuense]|uniref:glycosyltransferase n=1 Tax=Lichenibacterium dinghuense TaxID=2895977 RepID=UPI001F180E39|nr:glycosyltransferase [Lichenibacterium sp. 6Y81]
MSLAVLSVSYPLARVSPDSAGGAEQVLSALDRALVAAGHRSIVVAPAGSRVAGTLDAIPWAEGVLDEAAKARAQAANRDAVARVLARERVDLVHLHGIDFDRYLPEPGPPVLATLHLPPDWYPAEALRPARPRTFLNCVSAAQHAACPPSPNLVEPVGNGVPVARLAARHAKRGFALFLGRICPEKGVHLALRAAHRAEVSLLVAGELYPYAAHRDYFESEVRPLLDARRRFVGPVGFARKRRLLTAARCLLVPSLAAETSSLVVREAAACGTAVVAFPNGAIAEAVEHGRTGFLVADADAMAEAIPRTAAIAPEQCRALARARFDEGAMVARYLALYARLAASAA